MLLDTYLISYSEIAHISSIQQEGVEIEVRR